MDLFRKLRLFCEGALLLTENNTLLVGQPFICSNASSTSEPEFTVGPSGEFICISPCEVSVTFVLETCYIYPGCDICVFLQKYVVS